jgi:uncharacterized membrane protein
MQHSHSPTDPPADQIPTESEDFAPPGELRSRKRSLLKTLSWRVTATTTTFIIAWMVTGDLGAGAAIGGVEAAAKMFLYYGHERAWEHVAVT